ncbi:MAG: iron transporter [Haloplanus sp.]
MDRRRFLRTGAGLASGLLAGCLGFETQSAWRDPPLVEDRPDAVYYPAIVEGMGVYGTATADGVAFALMHSFPHRFWTLTGTNRTKVVVRPDDSLHLMASVWDRESGTVLPVDIAAEIRTAEGRVTSTNLWPMLSPTMGFHYGDNVALPGDGEYEVTLRIGPLQAARTEPFEGRFTGARSVTMAFSFRASETYDLPVRRLGEKAGTRGTVDLMEMGPVPAPVVPPKAELPGRLVGEASSGDATFLVTVVEGDSRFGDADGPSLLVSPRTPYNRVMLPRMTLSGTVSRGERTVFRGPLRASLDPEIGCFYGSAVPELRSGDRVRIGIETPPQIARHDGYETAFIDMPPVEMTVP